MGSVSVAEDVLVPHMPWASKPPLVIRGNGSIWNSKVLVLCWSAKTGTSSFLDYLCHAALGPACRRPQGLGGSRYWLHNVARWWPNTSRLSTHVPPGMKHIIRLALVRDPIDRYLSAFNDKLSCTRTDPATKIVHSLRNASGLPPGSAQSTLCMSFEEFVAALHSTHAIKQHARLDIHLRPQWMFAGPLQQNVCREALKLDIAQVTKLTPQLESAFRLYPTTMPHKHSTQGRSSAIDFGALMRRPREWRLMCELARGEYDWLKREPRCAEQAVSDERTKATSVALSEESASADLAFRTLRTLLSSRSSNDTVAPCGSRLSPRLLSTGDTASTASVPQSGPALQPGELGSTHLALGGVLLRVTAPQVDALICLSPKGGSTSFLSWLYERLSNQTSAGTGTSAGAGTGTGGPSARCPPPPRKAWPRQDVAPFTVQQLTSLQAQRQALQLPIPRFALVRHPLERAVSAFYSKIACKVGDGHEKARYLAKVRMPCTPNCTLSRKRRVGPHAASNLGVAASRDRAKRGSARSPLSLQRHPATSPRARRPNAVCGRERLGGNVA